MKRIDRFIVASIFMLTLFGVIACGNSKNKEAQESDNTPLVKAPEFNADSAYQYIKSQADFGPRVPNTEAHRKCGNYIASQLEKFGAKVYNQNADLIAYDGTILKSRNIIGAYRPESRKRVFIAAHWDSRPYADNDPDEKNHHTPILGVDDGASGVGVILEIARQISMKSPEIGIDLILFDSEDYGTPQFYNGRYKQDTWCLGSQYWGRTQHVEGYNARYGILLDMVGAKNATFYYEKYSARTANDAMKKIWNIAHRSNFGAYFIKEIGQEVTDDHVYVNQLARIPCVDIINYDKNNGSFEAAWHTLSDNMDNIDLNTLKAVGQTVMEVIYNEK